eukprot:7443877-Lingulodinium_polyedra.AAC.1
MDPAARRMSSMLVEVGQPSDDWHKRQNVGNRSPAECKAFYLEEAVGQGLKHLGDTLGTLRDTD